jgi:hypothetical protein
MGSSIETENRLAVIIAIDGLRASALGTYGNTAFSTPLFDELASRSTVIEWLFANGPSRGDFYQAALSAFSPYGVNCRLITDDSLLASSTGGNFFEDVLTIEPGVARSAKDLTATHAATFFAQSIEHLPIWLKEVTEQRRNGLLWLHFSGLNGPWDAPFAMRQGLLDEDDPSAPEFITPPSNVCDVTDPDELLGYRVAYAAQVSVIETCLAGFVEAFEQFTFEGKKLTMICGTSGFALGEHGCVGHDCQSLYSEQIHLPCLLMTEENPGPLPRVTGFAQPVDIGTTLVHWLTGIEAEEAPGQSFVSFLDYPGGKLRDVVFAKNLAGESTIHTPAWLMKQGGAVELYAKPDDRWEANDVASRCPEIVEQLCQHLLAMQAGRTEPLSEELTSPWR